MSKGSRKKRAGRPWQDPEALRDLTDLMGPASGDEELELPGYEVRRIDAADAVKDYICPACGNAVPSGEGHVVVWPSDESDLRRHWHRHCWRIEVRNSTEDRR